MSPCGSAYSKPLEIERNILLNRRLPGSPVGFLRLFVVKVHKKRHPVLCGVPFYSYLLQFILDILPLPTAVTRLSHKKVPDEQIALQALFLITFDFLEVKAPFR